MKPYSLLFLSLLLVGNGFAQSKPKAIDWQPCKDFTDQFKAQVEKFDAEHKHGPQATVGCEYSGDPDQKKVPVQHVPLSADQIKQLHALRKVEYAAFDAIRGYEDYLMATHHVHQPSTSDECWYFVGIVMDTDFITVDRNSGWPGCEP